MSLDDAASAIASWLIGDGRLLGDGIAIVDGFAKRLVDAGVPLARARVAQRMANPLLLAWGVIWTTEGATDYTVARSVLDTDAWFGSPFEYVLRHRTTLHKRLVGLNAQDHSVYQELAEAGGTDFFAMVLEYGDGSAQGCSFVASAPDGFRPEHLSLLTSLRHPLAAAMEPLAMRRSAKSLLRTYLGDGPARAVVEGTIRRGEHRKMDAAVMITDLRDFTRKSAEWREEDLLEALDGYFETVVDAVHSHGGDVLKFIGDGVLAVFPVEGDATQSERCLDAVAASRSMMASLAALNRRRSDAGLAILEMGIGIDAGQVTFGNIGSPDRLDFTVLGPAVNLAGRVQDLCKALGESLLATRAIAASAPAAFHSLGCHTVRGLGGPNRDLWRGRTRSALEGDHKSQSNGLNRNLVHPKQTPRIRGLISPPVAIWSRRPAQAGRCPGPALWADALK